MRVFEGLLPETVVSVEARDGDQIAEGAVLHAKEAAVIAHAVPKRRREFAVVRACAREAMESLGVSSHPVLPGERGAPRWPEGLIGSMTHCDGYYAAALARAGNLVSLGIDAEVHKRLPSGVLDLITLPSERARMRDLADSHPSVHWDRLWFSAKESVYKAWFPLTGKWLDFLEADIEIELGGSSGFYGGFQARLLVTGAMVDGLCVESFQGRWTVQRGLAATAVSIPASYNP